MKLLESKNNKDKKQQEDDVLNRIERTLRSQEESVTKKLESFKANLQLPVSNAEDATGKADKSKEKKKKLKERMDYNLSINPRGLRGLVTHEDH